MPLDPSDRLSALDPRSPIVDWKALPCRYGAMELALTPSGTTARYLVTPVVEAPFYIEACGAGQLVSFRQDPSLSRPLSLAALLVSGRARFVGEPSQLAKQRGFEPKCSIVVSLEYETKSGDSVMDSIDIDFERQPLIEEDDQGPGIPYYVVGEDGRYKGLGKQMLFRGNLSAGWQFRHSVIPLPVHSTLLSAMVLIVSRGISLQSPCLFDSVSLVPVPARLEKYQTFPNLYIPPQSSFNQHHLQKRHWGELNTNGNDSAFTNINDSSSGKPPFSVALATH